MALDIIQTTVRRAIITVALLFTAVIVCAYSNNSHAQVDTTKSPTSISEKKVLDDKSRKDLLVEMINSYMASFRNLLDHYKAYRERDPAVFINWRKKEWLPTHLAKQEDFNQTLDSYGVSVLSKDFQPIRVAIANLDLISLDVMRAIRDQDRSQLMKGVERFKTDARGMESVILDNNLMDRIIPPFSKDE